MVQDYNQVVCLRYHKPVRNVAESGSTDPDTGWYEGRLKATRKGEEGKVVRNIQKDWVQYHFQSTFVQLVNRKPMKWVQVIPGFREGTAKEVSPGTNLPAIKFRQRSGERTCIGKGLASALFHAGEMKIAQSFCDQASKLGRTETWLDTVKKTLKKKSGWYVRRTWAATVGGACKYRIAELMGEKKNMMTLVIPQGSDGGIEHALVVYEGYIFDAIENYALPVTMENLNWCCGRDGFHSLHAVHEIVKDRKNKKN